MSRGQKADASKSSAAVALPLTVFKEQCTMCPLHCEMQAMLINVAAGCGLQLTAARCGLDVTKDAL
eukprot:5383895-Pleurochrysis_carterae.AAC.1